MKKLPLFDPPEPRIPLSEIYMDVHLCKKCPLCETRSRVVFGLGKLGGMMLIGEAPGEQEDASGEPFVGKAGEMLTSLLTEIGIDREEVYVANTVKCRPPRNRKPYPDEVEACHPVLEAQINTVQPRVVVALGAFAATWLLGEIGSISLVRGKVWMYDEYRVVPTYHPAYLLRQPEDRNKVLSDLRLAKRML